MASGPKSSTRSSGGRLVDLDDVSSSDESDSSSKESEASLKGGLSRKEGIAIADQIDTVLKESELEDLRERQREGTGPVNTAVPKGKRGMGSSETVSS